KLHAQPSNLLDSLQLPKRVGADFETGRAHPVASEETRDLMREGLATQSGVLHVCVRGEGVGGLFEIAVRIIPENMVGHVHPASGREYCLNIMIELFLPLCSRTL